MKPQAGALPCSIVCNAAAVVSTILQTLALALVCWRLPPCICGQRATVTASDIDPVSVDVTRTNAVANSVPLGRRRGSVALYIATGTDHPAIMARAPYDLLIANILAGPLVELAPSFASVVADGGRSLPDFSIRRWTKWWLPTGATAFCLQNAKDSGDWPCLRLVKRRRYGYRRPIRASGRTSQPPGDFGTW